MFSKIDLMMAFLVGAAQSSLANVERYDPKTNTWSSVSHMLTRRSLLNVAAFEGRDSSLYYTIFKTSKNTCLRSLRPL